MEVAQARKQGKTAQALQSRLQADSPPYKSQGADTGEKVQGAHSCSHMIAVGLAIVDGSIDSHCRGFVRFFRNGSCLGEPAFPLWMPGEEKRRHERQR